MFKVEEGERECEGVVISLSLSYTSLRVIRNRLLIKRIIGRLLPFLPHHLHQLLPAHLWVLGLQLRHPTSLKLLPRSLDALFGVGNRPSELFHSVVNRTSIDYNVRFLLLQRLLIPADMIHILREPVVLFFLLTSRETFFPPQCKPLLPLICLFDIDRFLLYGLLLALLVDLSGLDLEAGVVGPC